MNNRIGMPASLSMVENRSWPASPPVKTWLTVQDVASEAPVPVISHGGYDDGRLHARPRALASGAHLRPGFVLENQLPRRVANGLGTSLAG